MTTALLPLTASGPLDFLGHVPTAAELLGGRIIRQKGFDPELRGKIASLAGKSPASPSSYAVRLRARSYIQGFSRKPLVLAKPLEKPRGPEWKAMASAEEPVFNGFMNSAVTYAINQGRSHRGENSIDLEVYADQLAQAALWVQVTGWYEGFIDALGLKPRFETLAQSFRVHRDGIYRDAYTQKGPKHIPHAINGLSFSEGGPSLFDKSSGLALDEPAWDQRVEAYYLLANQNNGQAPKTIRGFLKYVFGDSWDLVQTKLSLLKAHRRVALDHHYQVAEAFQRKLDGAAPRVDQSADLVLALRSPDQDLEKFIVSDGMFPLGSAAPRAYLKPLSFDVPLIGGQENVELHLIPVKGLAALQAMGNKDLYTPLQALHEAYSTYLITDATRTQAWGHIGFYETTDAQGNLALQIDGIHPGIAVKPKIFLKRLFEAFQDLVKQAPEDFNLQGFLIPNRDALVSTSPGIRAEMNAFRDQTRDVEGFTPNLAPLLYYHPGSELWSPRPLMDVRLQAGTNARSALQASLYVRVSKTLQSFLDSAAGDFLKGIHPVLLDEFIEENGLDAGEGISIEDQVRFIVRRQIAALTPPDDHHIRRPSKQKIRQALDVLDFLSAQMASADEAALAGIQDPEGEAGSARKPLTIEALNHFVQEARALLKYSRHKEKITLPAIRQQMYEAHPAGSSWVRVP